LGHGWLRSDQHSASLAYLTLTDVKVAGEEWSDERGSRDGTAR